MWCWTTALPICVLRKRTTPDSWPWATHWRIHYFSEVMRFVYIKRQMFTCPLRVKNNSTENSFRENNQIILSILHVHSNSSLLRILIMSLYLFISLICSGDWQLASFCPWPHQQGQRVDDRLWEDDPGARDERAPAQRPVGRGEQGGRIPHRPHLPHHLSGPGHQRGLLAAGGRLWRRNNTVTRSKLRVVAETTQSQDQVGQNGCCYTLNCWEKRQQGRNSNYSAENPLKCDVVDLFF